MFSFSKIILSSKFRSTSPIVDWHDEYKFLTNPDKKRWHFFRSPVKLTSRRPSSSPRVCTDGVRSYADVITKFSRLDELPFFLTHDASRARFARLSSAKNRKSNSKQKTSPQGYKTQINILPFPGLAQTGTEQFGQGATLLGWPKSIY